MTKDTYGTTFDEELTAASSKVAESVFAIGSRNGGGIARSRASAVLPSDTPDYPLGNPKQVSDLLADSVNRLHRGQLDPRVANAMGYLASVLLRALEQGPMEKRLAHLEALLDQRSVESDLLALQSTREVVAEERSTATQTE